MNGENYDGAMSAVLTAYSAMTEAQALVTLWRSHLAGEPGGKDDSLNIQRGCLFYGEFTSFRGAAWRAHIAAQDAYKEAVKAFRAVAGEDADWREGEARMLMADESKGGLNIPYNEWQALNWQAWGNAQATFQQQYETYKSFCGMCRMATQVFAPPPPLFSQRMVKNAWSADNEGN